MKKNCYKKILYLLGLTSMLTLNGCNTNRQLESVSIVDIIKENTKADEEDLCKENHLDEKVWILKLYLIVQNM